MSFESLDIIYACIGIADFAQTDIKLFELLCETCFQQFRCCNLFIVLIHFFTSIFVCNLFIGKPNPLW